MDEKVCTKCTHSLPLSAFDVRNKKTGWLKSWCRACCNKHRRRWYAATSKERHAKEKAYREKNPEHFRRKASDYQKSHLEGQAERNRKSRQKLREEVISHYGGRCACCGESGFEFLVIDHINGGNRQLVAMAKNAGLPANAFGGSTGHQLYSWIRRNGYPDGFRVLCHNCNYSIHFGGGTCLHTRAE